MAALKLVQPQNTSDDKAGAMQCDKTEGAIQKQTVGGGGKTLKMTQLLGHFSEKTGNIPKILMGQLPPCPTALPPLQW